MQILDPQFKLSAILTIIIITLEKLYPTTVRMLKVRMFTGITGRHAAITNLTLHISVKYAAARETAL